ncbi:MAG: hypothetical protein KFH87_09265, partial [Bacteroidetes bacterium]|nr:hypothetical protein [Bacteroidota bacterium]
MRLAIILSVILLFSQSCPLFAAGDGVPRSGGKLSETAKTSLLDQLPDDLEFVPGSIIVKFTRDREQQLSKSGVAISTVQPLLSQFSVDRMIQMYPSHVSRFRDDGSEIALQRMYRIEFDPVLNPLEVARAFAALPDVEYAEPEIVQTLMYTPDDPRYDEQYQYALIEAEKAWDITTGDSTIVIAIVDSGVRWDHEDLFDNMWINA